MKFEYAKCESIHKAAAVLFGADTNAGGTSESFLGAQGIKSKGRTPDFIRKTSNESPCLPRNLRLGTELFDAGNLVISGKTARSQIEEVKAQFTDLWSEGKIPFCLGGDHLVKHAALEALQKCKRDTLVLYVDAHPDIVLSDELNFVTVIHHALQRDATFVDALFLVGIRQINEAEAEGLRHWKPKIIWAQDFHVRSMSELYFSISKLKDRYSEVYLSIDLDGLDPSCAPAVEAPFPGGPTRICLNSFILCLKILISSVLMFLNLFRIWIRQDSPVLPVLKL